MLLSGGLDSTIITYLCKKIFKKVNAITCVFLNKQDFKLYKEKGIVNNKNYQDFVNAKLIAKKLKVNFFPVVRPLTNILSNLEKIM